MKFFFLDTGLEGTLEVVVEAVGLGFGLVSSLRVEKGFGHDLGVSGLRPDRLGHEEGISLLLPLCSAVG